MLPQLTEDGFLPEGEHRATWEEFQHRFVVFNRSDRRLRLAEGLERLVEEARKAGIVRRILIGGSFVTEKPEPNDFDCILVLDPAVVGKTLRPSEYNLISRRSARRLFGGDVVPVVDGSRALGEYLEFFQTSRNGHRVGIVEIIP
jgi:hypothetical protein